MKELYLGLGLGFNTNSYIRAIEPFLFHLKFRYLADLNKKNHLYLSRPGQRQTCLLWSFSFANFRMSFKPLKCS